MQPQQRQKPKHDRDRWLVVKRWSGLSKEAACAWDTLWHLAVEQGVYTLTIHPAIIGEDLGAGDRQRTGKRALDALEAHGLIFVQDRGIEHRGRGRGVWLIYLEDPFDVQNRRAVRASSEFQPELFDGDNEQDNQGVDRTVQAVVAPSTAPARSKVDTGRAQIGGSEVSKGNYLAGAVDGTTGCATDGATTACTVAKKCAVEPQPMADALAEAMNRLADRCKAAWAQQPEHAQKIAGRIEALVADPNLARPLCLRIAWAIIDGLYPHGKLETILDRIQRDFSHRSPKDRGSYFVRAVEKSFAECSLVLIERRKESTPEKQTPF
jgi:hypothetical protein